MSRTRAWVLVWLLPSTGTGSLYRRAALRRPPGRALAGLFHSIDGSDDRVSRERLRPGVAYDLRVSFAGERLASFPAGERVRPRAGIVRAFRSGRESAR